MKRIAVVGGGIAGLAAAYELELARKRGAEIDWHLYEASDRLGGVVDTSKRTTEAGEFILEGGPDAWMTEKPWARELAVELGLRSSLITSNDATRKTYILIDQQLVPMPGGMRMMVPEDLATLEGSPLFSAEARAAYAAELDRANELKAIAPAADESVASFVRRHFGEEVLAKIAAPLLSGVFGGDVERLSVQSVMPAFVTMEREYGSLIAALQVRTKTRGARLAEPIFTTLRDGLGSLVAAIRAALPEDRVHLKRIAVSIKTEGHSWCLRSSVSTARGAIGKSKRHFHHLFLATPIEATRQLLQPRDAVAAALLPQEASSAILATFCWSAEAASTFTVPGGFGFLVPQLNQTPLGEHPQLLATTFVDQKFAHRGPSGSRILRVFFGGSSAEALAQRADADVASIALQQLEAILGKLPQSDPRLTIIRRWPSSLPQYHVGHLDRMRELDVRIATLGGVTLLGNGYHGVGLPDLIRDARSAVRSVLAPERKL